MRVTNKIIILSRKNQCVCILNNYELGIKNYELNPESKFKNHNYFFTELLCNETFSYVLLSIKKVIYRIRIKIKNSKRKSKP
jgi:hypothetical protein